MRKKEWVKKNRNVKGQQKQFKGEYMYEKNKRCKNPICVKSKEIGAKELKKRMKRCYNEIADNRRNTIRKEETRNVNRGIAKKKIFNLQLRQAKRMMKDRKMQEEERKEIQKVGKKNGKKNETDKTNKKLENRGRNN